MSTNKTFWLAIDDNGEETIYEDKPNKSDDGFFWRDIFSVALPTCQIKAWGYKLKPGECMEVIGPNYDSKDEWYEQ